MKIEMLYSGGLLGYLETFLTTFDGNPIGAQRAFEI